MSVPDFAARLDLKPNAEILSGISVFGVNSYPGAQPRRASPLIHHAFTTNPLVNTSKTPRWEPASLNKVTESVDGLERLL